MQRTHSLKAGMILVAAATAAIGSGIAHAADVRIRGTIAGFDGSTLTVNTREGETTKIALKPDWRLSGVAAAQISDIKVGDYVGIASLPQTAGGDGALEVLIFPAALKGTGEGNTPWDLKPESSMTNGTIADTVKSVAGKTVTVTYKGKEKKIAIPDGTPVVTFAPATKADLKMGATVFVPSHIGDDNAASTGFVVVGTNGVVPPM